MTYKENITAILECNFAGFKQEIIDTAVDCIMALSENKTQMIDKSNFDAEQYKADLQSAYDCGYNKALSENERKTINASEEESEDQSVEWYCTDCPYFQYTGDPTDYWYGARCNKDGHEVNPSMMAIQELNNNCPINRG